MQLTEQQKKERKSKWAKTYYLKHKDKVKKNTASYRAKMISENPESFKEKDKKSTEKYRSKNKDILINNSRQSRSENPIKYRLYNQKHRLKKLFNLTIEQYNEMLLAQNNLCLICKNPETIAINGLIQSLSVDHDHKTGKIRGLLCGHCNRGLGLYKDSPELLREAALYLERTNQANKAHIISHMGNVSQVN